MQGRQCPKRDCKPRYFKVKPGTGCDRKQACCPYCGHEAGHQKFSTPSQTRYAKDLAMREFEQRVPKMVEDSLREELGLRRGQRKKDLGFGLSLELRGSRPVPRRLVRPPVEERLKRDLACPGCKLQFAVFGIATWCPDCGDDVFLAAVDAEFTVVQAILGDVSTRRERLGERVASRDVENALEDVVSTFEAVIRKMVLRALLERGDSRENAAEKLRKKGNCFQSVARGSRESVDLLQEDLFSGLTAVEVSEIERSFEARHPVTHNAGVVDRKYLDKTGSREREGGEVRISVAQVERCVELCLRVVRGFHGRLFHRPEV